MACARTVAVVVPSPATSDVLLATSFTICAPMFSSGSFSSISFATVTPSLVMVGDPNFLSRITFRPRGPSVTLTASGLRAIRAARPRREVPMVREPEKLGVAHQRAALEAQVARDHGFHLIE